MASYQIEMSQLANEELEQLRPFDRRPIVQAIRLLSHQAETKARNQKRLRRPLEELPDDTWELRIGVHRVLYEVRAHATVRVLRVIIKKGTTADSL
jgi:mRNA-degrading endonuclease RelE of RelBE toxin-antitoxin system